MNIIINGEMRSTEKSFLIDIIKEINISANGIAIAVNDEVISKSKWESCSLKENDNVLIITATQGG